MTAPWRRPDFAKLWLGRTVSRFGSYLGGAALSLTAILALAATPAQMGLLVATGAAPVLVAGLFAGVWVDRLRRRPILVAADIGRAVLLISIPLAALLGRLRIEQLYVVSALAGLLTVFSGVADQSFLPALVPREQLAESNSTLAASDSVAEVAGPAMAGSLVQWLGGPVVILVDAGSFLFSALCLGLIRTPEPRPVSFGQRRNLWREMVAGLRVVMGDSLLRALAGSAATAAFFGNFIGVLYELYAIRTLGLPVPMVGALVATGGAGAFVGALMAGWAVRRFGLGPTLIGTAVIGGGLQLLNPLAHGPAIMAVALLATAQLLGDIAHAIHAIGAVSLRQAASPDRLLGRVNASMQVLTEGAVLPGALVGGLLGETIGPRPTLLLAACGAMLSALWLFFSPLRSLRAQPEQAVESASAT